jgi:tRNA G10  N-methylase Trm11
MLYAFELGREWKLSLAEIESLFGAPNVKYINPKIAVLELALTSTQVSAVAGRMGGIIRAFEILSSLRDPKSFGPRIFETLSSFDSEKRITFWLGTIGGPEAGIFTSWLRLKKDLKDRGFSVRLVNRDAKNPVTAVVLTEKLVETGTEFFLLGTTSNIYYLARTIHIQDIDAYSARDLGKARDMEVGMLPPKLAQIMINLAISGALTPATSESTGTKPGEIKADLATPVSATGTESKPSTIPRRQPVIYDPFCGLGTVLIEAAHMGLMQTYASDISSDMVHSTRASFATLSMSSGASCETTLLDAKEVATLPYLAKVTHIVTEWYLGRIFGHHTIKPDLVATEKANLMNIYRAFFDGLVSKKWKGTVVITLPCWEVSGDTVYFGEFFSLFEWANWRVDPLLVPRPDVRLTKYGTLIYRRPGQTVGREVVRVVRK